MMKRLMTPLLAAAGLAAASLPGAVPAHAADVWHAKTSGGFVTLSYGPADLQARPVFLLSCLNGANIAVLSIYMDFEQRVPGQPLNIEVAAGGVMAPVGGETARDDASGVVYGDFGDIAVTPIVKVLREKGPVTIRDDAVSMELGETGRAAAVAEFSKDCKLD